MLENLDYIPTPWGNAAKYGSSGGNVPLDSPAFTGIPTAPTAAPGTNTTQLATTEFVTYAITLTGTTLTNHINLTTAHEATASNIASRIVLRDSNGDFAAGTITANLTGIASEAIKLQTARTINGIPFDGTTDITIDVESPLLLGETETTAYRGDRGKAAYDHINLTSAHEATASNTASRIVLRDSSGNFSAGTITANLTGIASEAIKLQTARTINGIPFDGTTDITISSGGGAGATVNYYFEDATILANMPVAVYEGKVYKADYSNDNRIDVIGFATENYELNVEKSVQKIGELAGLPILDKSYTPLLDEIVYCDFQNDANDLDNVSLTVTGTPNYSTNTTGGIMAFANSTDVSYSLVASQLAQLDITAGFSWFYEIVLNDITGTASKISNLLNFDNCNIELSMKDETLSIGESGGTYVTICSLTPNINYAIGCIIDQSTKAIDIVVDSKVYNTTLTALGILTSPTSLTTFTITTNTSGISQFGIYNGKSLNILEREIENLCLTYLPSKQIFLSSDGKVRYLDTTIVGGDYRIPLGYIKDKSSIDIQISEAVQLGDDPLDYFQDTDDIGTIKICTSGIIPNGWIRPDGRALNNTEYHSLYQIYSNLSFPWGNTTTTFNIPNYDDPYLILKVRYTYRRFPSVDQILHNTLNLQGGITNEYYHLSNSDYTAVVNGNNQSSVNIDTDYTVPNLAIGKSILIRRTSIFDGTPITISPPVGTTFEGETSLLLFEQYESITLERISTELFVLVGNSDSSSSGASITPGFVNTNGDVEEGTPNNFGVYYDTASTQPIDGEGTLPNEYVTIEASATNPLNGNNSLLITKLAQNCQGYGIYKTFNVETGSLGQQVEVSFSYLSDSNYIDSEICLFLIASDGTVFPPFMKELRASYNSPDIHRMSFVPHIAGEWKVCFHIAGTSTTSYTIKIDNIIPSLKTNIGTTTAGLTVVTDENYTIEPRVSEINVNDNNAAITIPSSFENFRKVIIRRIAAYDGNAITITPPTGATFEGKTSISLYGQYSYIEIEKISTTLFTIKNIEDRYTTVSGKSVHVYGKMIEQCVTVDMFSQAINTDAWAMSTWPIQFSKLICSTHSVLRQMPSGAQAMIGLQAYNGVYDTSTTTYAQLTSWSYRSAVDGGSDYVRYSCRGVGTW